MAASLKKVKKPKALPAGSKAKGPHVNVKGVAKHVTKVIGGHQMPADKVHIKKHKSDESPGNKEPMKRSKSRKVNF